MTVSFAKRCKGCQGNHEKQEQDPYHFKRYEKSITKTNRTANKRDCKMANENALDYNTVSGFAKCEEHPK